MKDYSEVICELLSIIRTFRNDTQEFQKACDEIAYYVGELQGKIMALELRK